MGNLIVQASILATFQKLTTAEVLAGITFRAAKALNLNDRGILKKGMKADFVVFETDKNDNCCENLVEVAGRSIDLLCRELSNYEMQGTYNNLKIKTKKIGLLDISKLEELYYLGYKQAKEFFEIF